MQTSLNPLVTNLISGDKLASTLTFGQFVKAIASFLAPILAAWGATTYLPTFGLGWRILFIIFAVVCCLSISALAATPIEEDRRERASSVADCLKLLGTPFVLLCFLGIMCHVGIDVGTNTTAPKILMERLGLPLEEATYATSIYFVFRTAGCFLGAFILRTVSPKVFFALSVAMMALAMALLFVGQNLWLLYVGVALIGFGNSNIFSIVFAQALTATPEHKNEVSGLMIMGLFGGTIFPLAMGYASDLIGGQAGAVAIMTLGVLYLIYYTTKIKK
jgi:fucose permease